MAKENKIRIIGGAWRSRKIEFPTIDGLRPTPNRVRETVFNWLAPYIIDANCLDLFSGSGALGFEALSRGAKQMTDIEENATAIKFLKQNKEKLKAENLTIMHEDAILFLKHTEDTFDIIFIDPPFKKPLVVPACELILKRKLLNPRGFIYIETKHDSVLTLPPPFKILKEKTAGEVKYVLAEILLSVDQ